LFGVRCAASSAQKSIAAHYTSPSDGSSPATIPGTLGFRSTGLSARCRSSKALNSRDTSSSLRVSGASVKRCHRLGLNFLSGRNMAAIDTTGGRSSLDEGESQGCVMKRLLAVVMIVSAALLSAPASADPGWGPDPCDYGGYCGNGGGGWDNGYYGGWYPGKWLFGGSGCVSGPFGFVQLCK
jgi:hypothetical protein